VYAKRSQDMVRCTTLDATIDCASMPNGEQGRARLNLKHAEKHETALRY
jgi:hypothetical protein